MSLTSIITVNFNQPNVTIDFLKSVKAPTQENEVEVILVDNGSNEDCEAQFKAVYPNVIYIRSTKNLGFAGGNNLGVAKAKGEYLLFLNNDTEIAPGLIEVLVAEMVKNPTIGLISPLILYYDEPTIIQYAGFTPMNYLTCRNNEIGHKEVDQNQYLNDSRETGYCHGAAMMCKRADLAIVGLMPDQFFLYYEEIDWCERFKKAGKKIWFTGKTKIYHKESMSVGKESKIKTYFMTRNRLLFIRRNTSLFNTILFTIYYTLIASPKQILVYLVKGRTDLIKYVFKGLIWNFTHHKNSKNLGFKI
ncbi:MAG: glycosyltransferase family 2 protein [Bacteroidota bacterium]